MENNIEIRPLQCIQNAVHIGDGSKLNYGFDYLCDDDYAYVIDPEKLARKIGAITVGGVDEKIMNRWIKSISRNRIDEFIEDENLNLDSISRRIISNWYGHFTPTNIIGAQIHDVMGRPYIPGSSIKGALRTAIVAAMAKGKVDVHTDKQFAKSLERKLTSGTSDQGQSVRSDFFRFVRATDAYFKPGCEAVISLPRLTFDKLNDIKVLLEVIAPGEDDTASFLLNIDVDRYNQAKGSGLMESIGTMPDQMKTIEGLFKMVNEHTAHLVEEEIKAWKLFKTYNAGKYVDTLECIKDECHACGDGECILRLGMGSGKIFITGAWAMGMRGVAAPKTRAVYQEEDENFNVLGFIKLVKVK